EAAEVGDHFRTGAVDHHSRRWRGDDGLWGGTGRDVALRRPDGEIATAQGEDARLADAQVAEREDGNRAAEFGDDARRGERIAKDLRSHGESSTGGGDGDVAATRSAD